MNRLRTGTFHTAAGLLASTLSMLTVCLAGCATRGNTDLLEAQLRRQESTILQFQKETARLREELAQSQKELELVRAEQLAAGQLVSAEEAVRNLARVEGLAFNTLLTAGQDRDGQPGDEQFHAIIYPHDANGEIVKLAGQIELEALDLSRPSEQRSLGRWKYDTEQVRQMWLSGFLSSGYQIEETWKVPPQGTRVLLVARLTTTDGRVFEATHTLPIESRPGNPSVPPAPISEVASAGAMPIKTNSSGESTEGTRRVPDPEPWEFDSKPSIQKLSEATEKSAESPALPPPNRPAPFPSGTKTSDNWTEETIPVLR
jgi:hypothetical protein